MDSFLYLVAFSFGAYLIAADVTHPKIVHYRPASVGTFPKNRMPNVRRYSSGDIRTVTIERRKSEPIDIPRPMKKKKSRCSTM
jgi:hypothetical protein